MKEKPQRSIPISCMFAIALIALFSIATTRTPALAVRPQVAAGDTHTVGLELDGQVLKAGYGSDDIVNWTDIVQIAAGYAHTVGLRSDGTVVATGCGGSNDWGQCDVGSWTNIKQVSAGYTHTVGVKSDGTVVATGCGASNWGQCDVGSWTDIVQVDTYFSTVGLKSNGSVVKVGYGSGDVGGWTSMRQVAAGYTHTVGLRSDGTVLAAGCDSDWGQCDVGSWTNIAQIAAGYKHTVGLKSNGTVLAVGNNNRGQCQVDEWKLTLFEDVPVGYWAEDDIYAIFTAEITKGCSADPLKYCPEEMVTRSEMAAFIVRAKEGEPDANYCDTGSPFSDVLPASMSCKYIKRLSELEITQGCGAGNYCPDDTVNRAQMAAFIVRAKEGEPDDNYCDTGSPFTDVSPGSWSCKYIKRLSELEITQGCGAGNYCPDDTVNRAQIAAFLARAFLGTN